MNDRPMEPRTLDEALELVPWISDVTGIARSEARRLVVTTWPAYDDARRRVAAQEPVPPIIADPEKFLR